jgi:hypothetical protein
MSAAQCRPAAATQVLVATCGDHILAASRRASADPERVDHQIEMFAPVKPWPRAHRATHAAHQHPDIDRLYVGTDRPRASGAFDQLCDDRDQFAVLGLRFRPRLPIAARECVPNPDVLGGRRRDTAQQPLDQCERFSVGLERLARPLGEGTERLTDQLRQQRLLGREVPVDRADADARVARDIVDPRTGAARALSRIRSRLRRASARSGRSVSPAWGLSVVVTDFSPASLDKRNRSSL